MIAEEFGIDKRVVRYNLRSFFRGGVKGQMKQGNIIRLSGFGTFKPAGNRQRELDRKKLAKLIKYRLKSRKYSKKLRDRKRFASFK